MQEQFKADFQEQMKDSAERALGFNSFFLSCVFTIINRPEDLAEGAGADRLVVVICKEGSGQIMPTCTVLSGIRTMM